MNIDDRSMSVKSVQDSIAADRASFLRATIKMALVLFGVYSIYNFVINDFPSAIMQAIMAVLLLVSLFLIQKNKDLKWPINISTFVLSYITLYNFSTGGVAETGVYWIFLFPGLVFTFQGKKNGLRWTLLVFFLIIMTAIGSIFYGFPKSPYSTAVIINQIIILAILSATSYFRQNIVEKGQTSLNELIEKSDEESKELKKALSEYENNSQELEKLNKFMTGRELKMIELKKRIAELEKKNI